MKGISKKHLKELKNHKDFLKLTLANQYELTEAFSFNIDCDNTSIQINVLDTGILMVEPCCATTKDLVLSCAIHGNETAPIEICNNLIKQILSGEIIVRQRVLFIFANPPAINLGKRFVEENMNTLFSGKHSKKLPDGTQVLNKERARVKKLENTLFEFYSKNEQATLQRHRIHYDLHTSIRGSINDKFAIYPFQNNKPYKKEPLLYLKQWGINTILLSNSPTNAFTYYSVNTFGADALTVELGKVKPFGENNLANFEKVYNNLHALITDKPIKLGKFDKNDFEVFKIHQTINRKTESFIFTFADDINNFTRFPVGYVLAKDGKTQYKIKVNGEAVIFPNADVMIGQRSLWTVIPAHI